MAIGTLALGIGASTAAYAVLHAVVLEPLPYPDEHELVSVRHSAPGIGVPTMQSAPFLHFTYVEQNRTFDAVGLWRGQAVTVTGDGQAHRLPAIVASLELLPLLGVEPALGRGFAPDDMAPESTPTVLVSDGYWRRHLESDPAALGRTLLVDGRSVQIIGVLPRDFAFLDPEVELVLPYQFDRTRAWLGGFGFENIARLRRGVTLEQANADVGRMISIAVATTAPSEGGSREAFAERLDLRPNVRLLRDQVVGGMMGTLWTLMGAISLVLVIALANVANLMLLRGERRRGELGTRAALGAGRARVVRELGVEGIVMGALAGCVGLSLAHLGLRSLVSIVPDAIPRSAAIGLDAHVVLVGALLAIGAGCSLGLLSSLRLGGRGEGIGGGRSTTMDRAGRRAVNGFVIVQVALSVVLLVGSGLMARTYRALMDVDLGFDRPHEVQMGRISIPEAVAEAEDVGRIQRAIVEQIRAIPGVESVGYASTAPMEPTGNPEETLLVEGRAYSDAAAPTLRRFEFVSPGYFDTIGTDLVAGRFLTDEDTRTRRPVALVSEALARQEWQTPEAAVGRRVRASVDEPWREIVGVVQDIHDDGPQVAPAATAYFPPLMNDFWGDPTFAWRDAVLVARGPAVGTEAFLRDFEEAVWAVDADLPVTSVGLLSDLVARTLARHALVLALLAVAGAVALFLGVVGLYGVLEYAASQRRREIGLRIALGADPARLRRALAGRGMLLAAGGVAAGVVLALWTSRFLASLLFGTSAVDAATFVAVSLTLLATAAVASYQPARRATRVSPVVAMRPE
jgi:predicted permease